MKIFSKCLVFLAACGISSLMFAATPKTLVFATEATYPPFESINNKGEIVGFDIEIIDAICKHSKLDCRFVNQPWDSLIPGLELGKFDMIFGAMNITDERRKKVDFTQPYYTSSGAFVAAKAVQLTPDIKSLKDKTIGVQGSTTYDYYLQSSYGKLVHINRYGSIQDAFLDLQAGRVDAVFGDTPIMLTWVNTPTNKDTFAVAGDPVKDDKFFNQGYGFAVKKGNSELLNQLNSGLAAIKADGTYQQISQKFFGKQ
jgi:arginine transport system substrate-binding protein